LTNITQSDETIVKINGVELCYDTFGNPSDPAILLIMGLGAQMIRWREEFLRPFAAEGFFVIRFDNRDVGKSSKFEEAGVPDVVSLMLGAQHGKTVDVPYTLTDMAQDAIGLLDALKIKVAHIVGISMGGMIAQTLAINFPDRATTLTSIMSTTGNPELPTPKPEAMMVLQQTPPDTREEYIESMIKGQRILSGPHFPIDEDYFRDFAGRAFDRSYYPQGTARQLAAVIASGSRKDALNALQMPTLIIHGDADPLVPVEGGRDTAASIPGAKLVIIKGMGHDIPEAAAPQVFEAIIQHIKR
jgi:pimeloyl-ACP methyl ester carboxylesterase